ncbi:MAG: hydrogenase maturation protease [Actinomycetota bacterium]|nr:hydrogenase maturation protease [Actinomycetota bacterium]
MTAVLVAGIGNIFFRDDGFGPEVVRRLADEVTDDVRVVDYGIRGMHLAYDLLDGVGTLVLVDTVPGPGDPGTISVREVGAEDLGESPMDAHGMSPVAVLANLDTLGGRLPPTFVVGCVPEDLREGMGLSGCVSSVLDEAVATVRGLVADRKAVV